MPRRHGRHIKVAPSHKRLGQRGIVYRSLAEKKFADLLDIRCKADGTDWDYEPKLTMFEGFTYSPDFVVIEDGRPVLYHEIKAFRRRQGKTKIIYRPVDPRWPSQKKIWRSFGPAELQVWTAGRNGVFTLVEVITPTNQE